MKRKIYLLGIAYLLAYPLFGEDRDVLFFSGYEWIVKESRSSVGPGPNRFSGRTLNLEGDSLYMTLIPRRKSWLCGEVYSQDYFSYGTYTLDFDIPKILDSQAVFGFFLYNDDIPPYYNEIDFEAARWSVPWGHPFSFSVQPYERTGNSLPFTVLPQGEFTCRIVWTPREIDFTLSVRDGEVLKHWVYRGGDIPRDTESRVHLNLWLYGGDAPLEDGGTEVEIRSFSFERKD